MRFFTLSLRFVGTPLRFQQTRFTSTVVGKTKEQVQKKPSDSDDGIVFNEGVVSFDHDIELSLGGARIPANSYFVKWTSWSSTPQINDKPVVFICPSMSHSPYVKNVSALGRVGWWDHIVGSGSQYGIDLNKFNVISACPLGSPYGSTSPLTINSNTNEVWGPNFPIITPEDMATAHKHLLDHFKIDEVECVVGASMGGMQALHCATKYADTFKKCIAIASTPATSPSAVAIRTNQRSAIINDTEYHGGDYFKVEGSPGPVQV